MNIIVRRTLDPALTVKYALDVYVEDVVPFVFREVVEGGTPSNTRIVYKDMKFALALFEFGDEGIAAGFRLSDVSSVL